MRANFPLHVFHDAVYRQPCKCHRAAVMFEEARRYESVLHARMNLAHPT